MVNLTWNDIDILVSKIADESLNVDNENTTILGVSRGGLVPAVMLSHKKNKSKFYSVGVGSYNGKNRSDCYFYQTIPFDLIKNTKTLYIVDDICDTGNTFKFITERMFNNNFNINVYTVSLILKNKSEFRPNFYGKSLDSTDWINFPWESTKS